MSIRDLHFHVIELIGVNDSYLRNINYSNDLINTTITQENRESLYNRYEILKRQLDMFTNSLELKIFENIDVGYFKNITFNEATKFYNKYCAILQDFRAVYHERMSQLRSNKPPIYIVELHDKQENIIMSMQVFMKINDCQFHMHISKSFDYFLKCINDNSLLNYKGLSVEFHKMTMQLTGAKRACAPPLKIMEEIIIKNFNTISLDFDNDNKNDNKNFNKKPDYSKIFIAKEDTKAAEQFWPNISSHSTYCFW